MLKPSDLDGVPVDLARAVISHAVTIAPCLDHLDPDATGDMGEWRERALAVLRVVAQTAARRGDPTVRTQRVGAAFVEYHVASHFTDDARATLEHICGVLCKRGVSGAPVGVFPRPGLVTGVWPEVES